MYVNSVTNKFSFIQFKDSMHLTDESIIILTCGFSLTSKEPIISLAFNEEDNHTWGPRVTNKDSSQNEAKPQHSRSASNNICHSLKLHSAQRTMCLKGRGTAHTLLETVRLSVLECQAQFQEERWNCSLGSNRVKLLQKGEFIVKMGDNCYSVSFGISL